MDKELIELLEVTLQKALEINFAGRANEFTAGGMAFNLYREIEELGVLGEVA